MFKNNDKVTPFQQHYGYRTLFLWRWLRFGCYWDLHPWRWVPGRFWGHPENDCLWYNAGPLAFYRW